MTSPLPPEKTRPQEHDASPGRKLLSLTPHAQTTQSINENIHGGAHLATQGRQQRRISTITLATQSGSQSSTHITRFTQVAGRTSAGRNHSTIRQRYHNESVYSAQELVLHAAVCTCLKVPRLSTIQPMHATSRSATDTRSLPAHSSKID